MREMMRDEKQMAVAAAEFLQEGISRALMAIEYRDNVFVESMFRLAVELSKISACSGSEDVSVLKKVFVDECILRIRLGTISFLLECGMPADQLIDPASGRTLLMACCSHGCSQVIESLLGAGADPNKRDLYGRTALGVAIDINANSFSDSDVIRLLNLLLCNGASFGDGEYGNQCVERLSRMSTVSESVRRDIVLVLTQYGAI